MVQVINSNLNRPASDPQEYESIILHQVDVQCFHYLILDGFIWQIHSDVPGRVSQYDVKLSQNLNVKVLQITSYPLCSLTNFVLQTQRIVRLREATALVERVSLRICTRFNCRVTIYVDL